MRWRAPSSASDKSEPACINVPGWVLSPADIGGLTFRYYEQEDLIRPADKSPAGYWLYDQCRFQWNPSRRSEVMASGVLI
jgi:hypothetical protein